MEYSSLDLQVTKSPEASSYRYRASILENGNVVAINDFELRQDLKLHQMLDWIEKKAVVSAPPTDENVHIEFGKMLYKEVFSGELGRYFNERLEDVRNNGSGLRISLRCDEGVPEIAALPWEYLHDDEDFLITRRSVLISRLPAGVQKKELSPLDLSFECL